MGLFYVLIGLILLLIFAGLVYWVDQLNEEVKQLESSLNNEDSQHTMVMTMFKVIMTIIIGFIFWWVMTTPAKAETNAEDFLPPKMEWAYNNPALVNIQGCALAEQMEKEMNEAERKGAKKNPDRRESIKHIREKHKCFKDQKP